MAFIPMSQAANHLTGPTGAPPGTGPDIEWRVVPGLSDYAGTERAMAERQQAIRTGTASEAVWLLEHPPLYTAGTSAAPAEMLHPRFPVFASGRGGRYTYHGPGQRVGYVMIDLERRCRDVRCYVHALEGWLILALERIDVTARRATGRVGIWCDDANDREAKIAAIGVRIRRWVTAHGFAINVAPDLDHYAGIVPCGISEYPVTSLAALGHDCTLADVDEALAGTFPEFLDMLAKAGGNCDIAPR